MSVATLDKPRCLHREGPVRECRECGAYLTTANEDDYCSKHGGWTTQRLTTFDALGELVGQRSHRKAVGEALDNLLEEAP